MVLKWIWKGAARAVHSVGAGAVGAVALGYGGTFYAVVTDCETGAAEYRPARYAQRHRPACVQFAAAALAHGRGGRAALPDGGLRIRFRCGAQRRTGREKNVVVLTRARGLPQGKNRAMFAIRRRHSDYPRLVEAAETRHLRYNETLELIRSGRRRGALFVIAPTAPVKTGRLEKEQGQALALYRRIRDGVLCAAAFSLRIAERFSLWDGRAVARYPVLFHLKYNVISV